MNIARTRHVFSQYDVEAFLRICRKYQSIIDNKECNKHTNKLKRATWIAIKNEYDCVPNVSAGTEIQLRQLYLNLKKRVAKIKAKEKMQIIHTDSEPKEDNEISQETLDRPVSMSSVVLSLKNLCANEDPQALILKNTTCSSDNFSINSSVECERVNEINDNEVISFADTLLASTESANDASRKKPAPYFMNFFEESPVCKKTKRKNSSDESSSDAYLPSSSKQTITCSSSSVPMEDRTMHGQVRREAHDRESPDSAFCHYIHTILTTIPDCFEKEKAKIQMTEILMKLKYPQT